MSKLFSPTTPNNNTTGTISNAGGAIISIRRCPAIESNIRAFSCFLNEQTTCFFTIGRGMMLGTTPKLFNAALPSTSMLDSFGM